MTIRQRSDQTTWYVDSDGDGYGNGFSASIEQCLQPTGYVADGSDYDDTVKKSIQVNSRFATV